MTLHNLLEILGNEDVLPKANKKAKLKLQKIENINTCLRYIKAKNINLINIGTKNTPRPYPNMILACFFILCFVCVLYGVVVKTQLSMSTRVSCQRPLSVARLERFLLRCSRVVLC